VEPFLLENGYLIDEAARTATLPTGAEPRTLFYYWTGTRNKPYTGLKSYGADKTYKPAAGRVTLASPIGHGFIHDIRCADEGTVQVRNNNAECRNMLPCKIALYCVEITAKDQRSRLYNVLTGVTESGRVLTDEECKKALELPVAAYTESKHKCASWLKSSTRYDNGSELDGLIKSCL